jgi:hypothetical protein
MFKNYYQNGTVEQDVQNCFLGLPGQEGWIRAVSSIRSTIDRLRPTKLTHDERQAVYGRKDVQAAQTARNLAKLLPK